MFDAARIQDFAPVMASPRASSGRTSTISDWIASPCRAASTRVDGRRPDPRPVLRPRTRRPAPGWKSASGGSASPSRRPPAPAGGRAPAALIFHGLDTFATSGWTARSSGGTTTCSARRSSTSRDRLTPGRTHLLAICFDPPLARIAGKTLSAWGRNPSAPPCARRNSATAGTGGRACRPSASGARSSCGGSGKRRSPASISRLSISPGA